MADGLNRVTIIGFLGKDPELRFTQSNMGALNFSVACNESWFDEKTKERKERVEWVNCVVWGKRAEGLNKCLSKGSRVCVEGRLQTRNWEDKQGVKRYSTEVVATNVVLLGGKGDSAGNPRGNGNSGSSSSADYSSTTDSQDDDQIPF